MAGEESHQLEGTAHSGKDAWDSRGKREENKNEIALEAWTKTIL